MPPKDSKDSNALTLLRRARTQPIMSMVRVGTGTNFTSAMTRMIFRNIHLAFISHKNEIIELNATENSHAPEQRDGAEPVKRMVRVAVKPGGTRSDAVMFDESINYETNSKFRSLTSNKSSKKPAFEFKEVPYDEWRKHYAKDKFGKYRGTEAPAEDAILVPEDEVKWRSAPVQTEIDQQMENDESAPSMEPVRRSATLPKHEEIDPEVRLQPTPAPAVQTQQEEAIFVDETGHTTSRIVQETKIEHASQNSPAAPIFLSPPNSPIR